jgi:hypothetical protein
MIRLFSYKLTHDTGFAPNPFWGVMTLSTCKPKIRLSKQKGDWIAGFTSQTLCGDSVGEEKLVYLMEVTDKFSLSDYFNSPIYKKKIPNLNKSQCVYLAGDNIYRPTDSVTPLFDNFEQLENPYHGEKHKQRDLSGKFILAGNRFFYFGSKAIQIPLDLRPNVPRGQSAHGSLTIDSAVVQRFIDYIISEYRVGVQAAPHSWPSGDSSWNMK